MSSLQIIVFAVCLLVGAAASAAVYKLGYDNGFRDAMKRDLGLLEAAMVRVRGELKSKAIEAGSDDE